MINLLLGAPGGGKSYEAVAYHVIPALADGRKVITNLPLVLDAFPPEQRRLIELREHTKAEPPEEVQDRDDRVLRRFPMQFRPSFSKRAFANAEDYGDPWRHPETGAGPLYVIDECHLCLPRQGTPKEVPEWFSLHRHEFADVLLITQSYGKVQKDIIDLVQVCYRVRKATALGFSGRYIRKVFDGVKGECMNENVREYDKTYFKFYRSHTRSSKAGQELEAKDIVPIWKHWSFKGAALCLLLAAGIFTFGGTANPTKAGNIKVVSKVVPHKALPAPTASAERKDDSSSTGAVQESRGGGNHPLAGYRLHVSGYLHSQAKGDFYLFSISQNGQRVFSMNSDDLRKAGYEVVYLEDCVAKLTYEGQSFFSVCDAPTVSVSAAVPTPVKNGS